jgi:selenocysteine lyase/cysteine desulfurase
MFDRLGSLENFPPAARYSYLDAASVALMHSGAAAAISDWQRSIAENGTVVFDEKAEVGVLDRLSLASARLLGARPEEMAVASSETVLMSSLAWAVAPRAGTTIIATDICHPSTIYPWSRVARHTGARLKWVAAHNQYVDPREIEAAIDDSTAVVCLSHVEYGTGQVYDIPALARQAHAVGAIIVLDATQSAGQVPIDTIAMGVDAVAFSTYKWLCGPFGVGCLFVSPSLQELDPGIVGWRSHVDMWDFQADRLIFPASAKRFEFGTMAYGCALGAAIALEHALKLDVHAIHAHNRQLSDRLIAGLRTLGAEILSPEKASERSSIVAARFPGHASRTLVAGLKRHEVILSLRGDFLRFSPHLYNSSEDIDRALSELTALVAGGKSPVSGSDA